MPTVTQIDCVEELARLRLLWSSLLQRTRQPNYLQTLDWLLALLGQHEGRVRPRVLLVESGGQPAGILPLVERCQQWPWGAHRVVGYPVDEPGRFYAPIGPEPSLVLAAGMQHLARTGRDWDLLDLRCVNRDGLDYRRTETAMRCAGLPPREAAWGQSPRVRLGDDWDTYWNARREPFGEQCRRLSAGLSGSRPIEFVRHRPQGAACGDADPRWDLYEACTGIIEDSAAARTTREPAPPAGSDEALLRRQHQCAARAGGLDVNLLLLGTRPLACAYNYHFAGHVLVLRIACDATAARHGGLAVLLGHMIRDSSARGDHTIDFGPQWSSEIGDWQTDSLTAYRYTHGPSGAIGARLARLGRWLAGRWIAAPTSRAAAS